uniref:Uncharacterized protein n=1 Tax=Aotus nancymaae TaxID=37293 RepID=A0A2K5EKE8_AOTNA
MPQSLRTYPPWGTLEGGSHRPSQIPALPHSPQGAPLSPGREEPVCVCRHLFSRVGDGRGEVWGFSPRA